MTLTYNIDIEEQETLPKSYNKSRAAEFVERLKEMEPYEDDPEIHRDSVSSLAFCPDPKTDFLMISRSIDSEFNDDYRIKVAYLQSDKREEYIAISLTKKSKKLNKIGLLALEIIYHIKEDKYTINEVVQEVKGGMMKENIYGTKSIYRLDMDDVTKIVSSFLKSLRVKSRNF